MENKNKIYRSEAKRILEPLRYDGSVCVAVAIFLIIMLIDTILELSTINGVVSAIISGSIAIFITAPLISAFQSVALDIARGNMQRKQFTTSLFANLSQQYSKYFEIYWLLVFKIILRILIPMIVFFIALEPIVNTCSSEAIICAFILYVICIYSILIKPLFAYLITPCVIKDNPELSSSKAFKKSMNLVQGNCWNFFFLLLSFLGWYVLCVITLGIAMFRVYPYAATTLALYYEDLKANANKETNEEVIDDETSETNSVDTNE